MAQLPWSTVMCCSCNCSLALFDRASSQTWVHEVQKAKRAALPLQFTMPGLSAYTTERYWAGNAIQCLSINIWTWVPWFDLATSSQMSSCSLDRYKHGGVEVSKHKSKLFLPRQLAFVLRALAVANHNFHRDNTMMLRHVSSNSGWCLLYPVNVKSLTWIQLVVPLRLGLDGWTVVQLLALVEHLRTSWTMSSTYEGQSRSCSCVVYTDFCSPVFSLKSYVRVAILSCHMEETMVLYILGTRTGAWETERWWWARWAWEKVDNGKQTVSEEVLDMSPRWCSCEQSFDMSGRDEGPESSPESRGLDFGNDGGKTWRLVHNGHTLPHILLECTRSKNRPTGTTMCWFGSEKGPIIFLPALTFVRLDAWTSKIVAKSCS